MFHVKLKVSEKRRNFHETCHMHVVICKNLLVSFSVVLYHLHFKILYN